MDYIAVTGAKGFLGKHLVHHLVDKGFKVLCLGRNFEDEIVSGHLEYSSATSLEDLCKVLSGVNTIVHLATYFTNSENLAEKQAMLLSNVEYLAQIAIATKESGIKYFINIESMSQHVEGIYGNHVSFYSQTKNLGSQLLDSIARDNYSVLHLCLFDTYGQNDTRGKLIQVLLSQKENSSPLALSAGEQFVDIIHASDVAEGIIHGMKLLLQGELDPMNSRYRLSSRNLITLRQLIQELETVSGKNFNVEWGARPYRPGEMFSEWEFPPLLPKWLPGVTLQTGLRGIL